VTSFQTPAAATATAPATTPPARTAVQQPVEPPPADVAPAQPEAPRQIARAETELPQTASPIPLAGLAGLVSFAGALGVRMWRRR